MAEKKACTLFDLRRYKNVEYWRLNDEAKLSYLDFKRLLV